MSLLSELDEDIAGEIEIGSFPAVNQYRALDHLEFSSANVLSYTILNILRQSCKTIGRIAHDDFGDSKALAIVKRVTELFVHEAHLEAGVAELVSLRFAFEAAAVYMDEGVGFAGVFICQTLTQNSCAVVLVRGHTSSAADYLSCLRDWRPEEIPLHRVTSVKCNKVIVAGHEIENCTLSFLHINAAFAPIFKNEGAGDDVIFGQHAVEETRANVSYGVLERDFQRLSLVLCGIDSREPVKAVLALPDFILYKTEIAGVGSIRVFDDDSRAAIVTGAACRELLR